MMYAEAAYFDGVHVAHIAAWQEHRRLLDLQRKLHARFVNDRHMPPRMKRWAGTTDVIRYYEARKDTVSCEQVRRLAVSERSIN